MLSESGIRRGLKDGSIKGYKVARDWVLEPEEVDRLAAKHPLDQALLAVISGAEVVNAR